MAFLKIVDNKYVSDTAVSNLVYYISNTIKTLGIYMGGFGICELKDKEDVIYQFNKVKDFYGKNNGNRLRHFIVSFCGIEDFNPSQAYSVAMDIAKYYGMQYQVFFGVHMDKKHLHIHFMMNTVSYVNGKRYAEGKEDFYMLKKYVDDVIANHLHYLD